MLAMLPLLKKMQEKKVVAERAWRAPPPLFSLGA